ncbi:hypothetical protein [Alkalicoccobacillus murimartini]|uniref:Uncharacterized protein n=1 Tax=Alkalicoccobacillus murimartini TaxID=171685 RepID=A0ABT9YD87_9BACI|nr:hypothetical protein [Alkalicoccobacillus murimartini]MDQ0205822.1 hypothetical protein [Alkalicoccobacillus murimartini]
MNRWLYALILFLIMFTFPYLFILVIEQGDHSLAENWLYHASSALGVALVIAFFIPWTKRRGKN